MSTIAIVILTYNVLEEATKLCLESLFRIKSELPFTVVVVDNGSTDGTREYLQTLAADLSNLSVILNDENYGYAKANNIGIKSVEADYYILLNNDTVVTDYWIDKMVEFLERHTDVGMVGPVSNNVGNEQMIFVEASDFDQIVKEGEEWAQLCKEDFFYTEMLGFFCVCIKSDVIKVIGLLDEEFGVGTFEDDDYCFRAHHAGIKMACVEDVFIFHKGNTTFNLMNIDINSTFARNLQYFENKHNTKWVSGENIQKYINNIFPYVDLIDDVRYRRKLSNKLMLLSSKFKRDIYAELLKLSVDNNALLFQYNELNKLLVSYDEAATVLKNELNVLKTDNAIISEKNAELSSSLQLIMDSLTWRIASRIHKILNVLGFAKLNKILNDLNIFRRVVSICKFISSRREEYGYRDKLNKIIEIHKDSPIILFRPLIDWDVPLFQRPQHIAVNLSNKGYIYFYCTENWEYDHVDGFENVTKTGYITNKYNIVSQLNQKKILHLCSTDNITTYDLVSEEIKKGNIILYEYIDEIHDLVSGIKVPESVFIKHQNILADERCIVIASADKLYKDVLKVRAKNCCLVTNGVDCVHFQQKFGKEDVPADIATLVASGRPIIGYFGALASWFDYELVMKAAEERPDYTFLLIGWNYDKSLDEYSLDKFSNVNIIGPINYKDLPRYAHWFDVSTIPFRLNEITESTSPIKLFEYMALGKPIVTTGMPECRKYRSVLIGEDHGDFIRKLDQAIALKEDDRYSSILHKEATENTWERKAAQIETMIDVAISRELVAHPGTMPAKSWVVALADCQRELISIHKHPYYAKTYQPEEAYYWSHVARWMHEDSLNRKVATVLDVGCAYGTLSLYASNIYRADVFAIDFVPKFFCNQLTKEYNITFSVNNVELEDLPWNRKFDMIIFTEVIEHLNFHPLPTLRKIKNALATGGKLFLSTPDAAKWGSVTKYYKSLDEMPLPSPGKEPIDDHVWQYTEDELTDLLHAAGFTVEQLEHAPGCGAPHINLIAF